MISYNIVALWSTARYKNWTSLRPFIEDEGVDVDMREPVALTVAQMPASCGNGKAVELENCLGMTPLYAGISSGHEAGFATLLYLLDNGADVNALGYVASVRGVKSWDSVLGAAVQSGSEDAVRHLLQRGADPTALRCVGGRVLSADDVLPSSLPNRKALLSLLCAEPYTDAFVGARTGDLVEVQRALNRLSVSVDMRDAGGNTVLMRAAMCGQLRVAEYLLERRAKVDEANAFGYTALWFAAFYGHERLVRLLLEHGADPTVACIEQRVAKKKWAPSQRDRILQLLRTDSTGIDKNAARTVMWAGYAWLCICFLLLVLFLNERATFNMLAGSDSDHVKSMSPRQIETCIKRWCHLVPSEGEMGLRSAAELKEMCRACQREWTPVPNMTLAFHDLVVKGDDFTILERASGEFLPGKLTAIMGSSGDGKSTLINAIRGSTSGYRDVQGAVVFDNRRMSVRSAGAVLRPLTGFVPQEDVYYDYLTVEENLLSQLYWRSSPRRHPSEKAQKLKLVLEDLGIAHLRHKRCRGRVCSGGQKKRVSIAMELVGDPSILFLDEPTSGLDYVTSHNLVSMLKGLTQERRVHVSVIVHQPAKRIFDMFDTLFLIKKGHIVYAGDAAQAVELYKSFGYDHDVEQDHNPSEWLVEVLHGHLPNHRHGSAVDEDQILYDWINHLKTQQRRGNGSELAAWEGGTCGMAPIADRNASMPTCDAHHPHKTPAQHAPTTTVTLQTTPSPQPVPSSSSSSAKPPSSTKQSSWWQSLGSWLRYLVSWLSPWAWWEALKLSVDGVRVALSGMWAKFGAVFYRECLIHARRGGQYVFTVPIIVGGLAGALRGLIGRQCEELEGGSFMLSIGSTLVFMVHAVSIFGLDGAMRKRELEAGMDPWVYFAAKSVFGLIPALFLPLVLCLAYVLTAGVTLGMQNKHSAQQWWALKRFHLHTYFLLLLCGLTCQSVGFCISLLMPDISMAYLVVVGSVLFFHVNGSFTPRLSQWAQLPFQWPQVFVHLSYVTYFLALMLITQPAMDDWKDPAGYISYRTKQRLLLQTFGYSPQKYRRYLLGGLFGGAVAWRIATFWVFMATQSPG